MVVGAQAKLAPSLITGPPDGVNEICDRRMYVDGRPTDWLVNAEGEPTWSPLDGTPPFTWEQPKTVRCPKCKRTWTTTAERRALANVLAELGDARPDGAALLT